MHLPSFEELIESAQLERDRIIALAQAKQAEIVARNAEDARKLAETDANNLAQRLEMITIISQDAASAAERLLKIGRPQDFWATSAEVYYAKPSIYLPAQRKEVSKRNMLGWLVSLSVKSENRIAGYNTLNNPRDGEFTTANWETVHTISAIVLSSRGKLLTTDPALNVSVPMPRDFRPDRIFHDKARDILLSEQGQGLSYKEYIPSWIGSGAESEMQSFNRIRARLAEMCIN